MSNEEKEINNQAFIKFKEKRRNEYIKSFKRAKRDKDVVTMAEEGIEDYLKLIDRSISNI